LCACGGQRLAGGKHGAHGFEVMPEAVSEANFGGVPVYPLMPNGGAFSHVVFDAIVEGMLNL